MTSILPSAADEVDVELYTQGSCHAFAIALHRNLGMGILVVTDPESPYWQDEADGDNFIPSVTHVYATDHEGNAWDVRGSRPGHAVRAEVEDLYPDALGFDTDECRGEIEMVTYVDGMGEDVDRPLHSLSDDDVAEAWTCALRVLSDVPGFTAPALRPFA